MGDQRSSEDSGQTSRAPRAETDVTSTPPPPARREGKRAISALLVIAIVVVVMMMLGGLMLVALAVVGLARAGGEDSWGSFGARVGVVTVSGPIATAGQSSLFGPPIGGSGSIMSQLRRAGKDKSVKAVVLRVNSPGGTAAASQAIHEEVRKLAKQKPVVASMGDVAASGGYYVAAAADKIVANPSTVTGSIGVRWPTMAYHELLDKIGVDGGDLTTGRYKDTGSPWREMREDERKLLQNVIDNVYDQFVRDVAEGRGRKEEEVRKLADGRVLTGEQAKKVKLVDELGNFHDAVKLAAELGKIKGEPKLKYYGAGGGLRGLLGSHLELQRRRCVYELLRDYRLEGVERLLQMEQLVLP